MTDNAATAQTLFDAWERRDFDTVSGQLPGDVSLKDAPRSQIVHGQAHVRDWYAFVGHGRMTSRSANQLACRRDVSG